MQREPLTRSPHGGFPTTRQTLVEAVGSSDEVIRRRGIEALVAAYWKPVYKYLRWKWKAAPEEAEDLTQGFFLRCLEQGFLERYDPRRARFRTWLRTGLDGFAANERKAAGRLKRGGGMERVAMDFSGAEEELARQQQAGDLDAEAWFHREWVRALFARAVEELEGRCRERGREVHFRLFERYDLEGTGDNERPTYGALAAELGLTTLQVTNYLASVRRELRRLVLDLLREATGSETEFRAEARELLGVEPR